MTASLCDSVQVRIFPSNCSSPSSANEKLNPVAVNFLRVRTQGQQVNYLFVRNVMPLYISFCDFFIQKKPVYLRDFVWPDSFKMLCYFIYFKIMTYFSRGHIGK